jgi:hypothetical protein
MLKPLKKLGIEESYLNKLKVIFEKCIAIIKLTSKTLKAFHSK